MTALEQPDIADYAAADIVFPEQFGAAAELKRIDSGKITDPQFDVKPFGSGARCISEPPNFAPTARACATIAGRRQGNRDVVKTEKILAAGNQYAPKVLWADSCDEDDGFWHGLMLHAVPGRGCDEAPSDRVQTSSALMPGTPEALHQDAEDDVLLLDPPTPVVHPSALHDPEGDDPFSPFEDDQSHVHDEAVLIVSVTRTTGEFYDVMDKVRSESGDRPQRLQGGSKAAIVFVPSCVNCEVLEKIKEYEEKRRESGRNNYALAQFNVVTTERLKPLVDKALDVRKLKAKKVKERSVECIGHISLPVSEARQPSLRREQTVP